jgi:hypothetical protein
MTGRIYLQHPSRDETVAVGVGFIGFAIYCGIRANEWHRRVLERKGYVVLPGR